MDLKIPTENEIINLYKQRSRENFRYMRDQLPIVKKSPVKWKILSIIIWAWNYDGLKNLRRREIMEYAHHFKKEDPYKLTRGMFTKGINGLKSQNLINVKEHVVHHNLKICYYSLSKRAVWYYNEWGVFAPPRIIIKHLKDNNLVPF